jgi:hypothetical protein
MKTFARLTIAAVMVAIQTFIAYILLASAIYIYVYINGSIRQDLYWGRDIFFFFTQIQIPSAFVANFLLLLSKKPLHYIIIIGVQTALVLLFWGDFYYYPYRAPLMWAILALWIAIGWLLAYKLRIKIGAIKL